MEALRIVFDQRLHERVVEERHCREDVMARAALQEQRDHPFVAFERRPADHASVVQVAAAVHVGAGVEERADAVEGAVGRRHVQRARIVSEIAGVGVGAVIDEQANRVGGTRREVEPRCASRDALPGEARILAEEFVQGLHVAGTTRPDVLRHVRRAAAVHFGLQRPPALEPVIPSDRQLSVSEPPLRIPQPEQGQALFR